MNKHLKIFAYILLTINLILIIKDVVAWSCGVSLTPNGYEITEFLINYQGGFVRRGLLGEILFHICSPCLDPRYIIIPICVIAATAYITLIVFLFKKENLSLWILYTFYTLFGGICIRKDYIIMLLVLAIIYMLKRNENAKSPIYLYAITGISVFMLNIHEASFFIILPLTFAYILFGTTSNTKTWERLFLIVIPVSMFVLLSAYKGDNETALRIGEAWKRIFPCDNLDFNNTRNSITALTWSLGYATEHHLGINFASGPIWKYSAILLRPIVIAVILYLMVHVSLSRVKEQTNFQICGTKLINYAVFQFISLFPMFTILSCDLRRVCFYWTMSTFMGFIFLRDVKLSLPWSDLLQKTSSSISKVFMIKSPIWVTYALLLTISVPYFYNKPSGYLSPLIKLPYKVIQYISNE